MKDPKQPEPAPAQAGEVSRAERQRLKKVARRAAKKNIAKPFLVGGPAKTTRSPNPAPQFRHQGR